MSALRRQRVVCLGGRISVRSNASPDINKLRSNLGLVSNIFETRPLQLQLNMSTLGLSHLLYKTGIEAGAFQLSHRDWWARAVAQQ